LLRKNRAFRSNPADFRFNRLRGTGERAAGEDPVHVVSARAGDGQIVLGQIAVDEKSNEITAIPKLPDLLDIREGTVTIDAMGCQRETRASAEGDTAHAEMVTAWKQ
jgi:hypothetical protein